MNPEQLQLIETKLLQLVAAHSDQLPDQDIRELRSLINAGEPGVALENLCTQLYEYESSVTPQALDHLLELGQSMGMDLSRWKALLKPQ